MSACSTSPSRARRRGASAVTDAAGSEEISTCSAWLHASATKLLVSWMRSSSSATFSASSPPPAASPSQRWARASERQRNSRPNPHSFSSCDPPPPFTWRVSRAKAKSLAGSTAANDRSVSVSASPKPSRAPSRDDARPRTRRRRQYTRSVHSAPSSPKVVSSGGAPSSADCAFTRAETRRWAAALRTPCSADDRSQNTWSSTLPLDGTGILR
mmetsp:Transcript_5290/g.11743  ORF Transcript_5290/g.11743 Transcript_5290/m.11743 type:complete len:213 (-) Transcript_5290:35-673(-)